MGTETQGKIIDPPGEARDAQAIYRIGTLCFTDAWREETVAHDLAQPLSRYWVAEVNHQVAAFACFWFVVDELQLVNDRGGTRPAPDGHSGETSPERNGRGEKVRAHPYVTGSADRKSAGSAFI